MLKPHRITSMFSIALMSLAAGTVFSQNYPNKPIRIVTSEASGGNDFTVRLIVSGVSGPLGQQVIIDNRGSAVSGEIVAKAPPDGYVLLFAGNSLMTTPMLRPSAWDAVRDFSPITVTNEKSNILAVHPSLPVNSVKELLTLAKTRPGELNYSSGGMGSGNNLAAELFKSMAGVNMTRINYKGSGPALQALIGGETQLMIATAPSVTPHVKSKRLRALAVTSAQASPLYPDLPTVAAAGVPGYEAVAINGIFAPAGTAAPIINRLNQEIVRVLNQPDVKDKLASGGVDVIGNSPEQAAATIRAETARMSKVIKDAGIRGE